MLTDAENTEVVRAVQRVVERYQADDFKLFIAGSPVITDVIKRSMMRDMSVFVRLVILTIGFALLVMFRRLSGVIYPLIVVTMALLCTLGLMAIFGVPIKTPTTVLPSFILAVGVGASVHLLSMYYQGVNQNGDRQAAIREALGHSGLPIVMTGLTTAAGLLSFAAAEVAPVADLGIFSSIGVLLALIFTLLLLPALLAITPVRPNKKAGKSNSLEKGTAFFNQVADFSTSHPKAITLLTVLIIAVSLLGAFRLHFTHDVLVWLPEKLPIRVGTTVIDREMNGSVTMDVIVDTGRENGLYDLKILDGLDRLGKRVEGMSDQRWSVGKVTSVTDMLKEIHQALNGNRSAFYAIPRNPELIPQEFLLFENSGSDDLEDVVDSRFSQARFTIKGPWTDSVVYAGLVGKIDTMFKNEFQGQADITVTGLTVLMAKTVSAAIKTMAQSYAVAGLVITVMMILLIGSIRVGLVSMIPNLLPICLTLGLMGWLDLPLDLFTMLIGSIAIGLAVDDTVHFMHNFRRYHYETGDTRQSVRMTLNTSGRAMLVTSLVLSLGFFIFLMASMNNLFYFGLLTGITIIAALVADFIVSPALMSLMKHPVKTNKGVGS